MLAVVWSFSSFPFLLSHVVSQRVGVDFLIAWQLRKWEAGGNDISSSLASQVRNHYFYHILVTEAAISPSEVQRETK